MPGPWENEALSPVLKAEELGLADEAGRLYGPLDLAVRPGEMALVVVRELAMLWRLMRSCLGLERPDSGRLSWWPGADPGRALFRQIGYVDRQSQLLHRWSLLDHFRIFESYSGHPGDPGGGWALGTARVVLKDAEMVQERAAVQKLALAVHTAYLPEKGSAAGVGPGPPGKPAGMGRL